MGEQKSGIQVTLDYFSAAEVCHSFGKSLLGVAFICMVKLRGFCFKGADFDNAAAITIGFFVQDGNKHCGGAAAQRFAKSFFSMCSTGFWIDFRFLAALLQGFVVHIFNHELVAMFQQFVSKDVVLHLADIRQSAV